MAINYSKVNWDTTKYVNPTNMNQMDEGIKQACDRLDSLAVPSYLQNGVDLNTITETGVYRIGDSAINIPAGSWAYSMLEVQNGSGTVCVQTLHSAPTIYGSYVTFKRAKNGDNGWTSWDKVFTVQNGRGDYKNNVNLNSIVNTGFYNIGDGCTNKPVNTWGYLTVIQWNSTTDECLQTFVDSSRHEYKRILTGGSWSAWKSDTTWQLAYNVNANTIEGWQTVTLYNGINLNNYNEILFEYGSYGNTGYSVLEPIARFLTHTGTGNRVQIPETSVEVYVDSDRTKIHIKVPTGGFASLAVYVR